VRGDSDVVVVGGGIAGGALACALARGGVRVTLLERSAEYRDRVKGEYLQPWGVAEAQRLGLLDVLVAAGGNVITRLIGYDENLEPAEAEAGALALDEVLPGVPGALGVPHPVACGALTRAAVASGATVLRGVTDVDITPGPRPSVRWLVGGASGETTCRLVIGADGRESAVRRQAGLHLEATTPRLLGAGLFVEGVDAWPNEVFSIGTEDDRLYFVIPQGDGRARLYLMYDSSRADRLAGAGKAAQFLEWFALRCVPRSEHLVAATPAGPCAVYPMNDTWCDPASVEGVVLVGDAAGYSDPHIGQGLSIALRDVRLVSDTLFLGDDWRPTAFVPYAEERAERMRRLRWVNDVATTMRGEFGPEARDRRRRATERMRDDPSLTAFRRSTVAGPEQVPPEAFDDSVRERLLAP
jgi:2-polyprenyl-6-methoxyphenol hydroxylase-like FAD-dependent oxidoreductase